MPRRRAAPDWGGGRGGPRRPPRRGAGPAGAVDDVAGPLAQGAVAGEEASAAGAGQEAEVLRVLLARDRESGGARDLAHLRLALDGAEREAQALERRAAQRGEHVALVLGRVGGLPQQAVVRAPRVVAGRERPRPEAVGERKHRVEPDVAVAADARVRRQACLVVLEPWVDDARAELVAEVEREVREAHAVGERPGLADGVGRAARALAVV